MEKCCFKKGRYIFQTGIELPGKRSVFKILKTHRHNSIIVNTNVLKLMERFDGKRDLRGIFEELKNLEFSLLVYSIASDDILEITDRYSRKDEIFLDGRFEDLCRVVKLLYINHLVELEAYNISGPLPGPGSVTPLDIDETESLEDKGVLDDLLNRGAGVSRADILLLGDTTGTATVGMLYLASYLRRKGFKAVCQFKDTMRDSLSLEQNIEELLEKVQPRIVGISMKWFPHMARVLEICKIVKAYSPGIKVVLGGDTASYFRKEIIGHECVDYIIRGEGEEPLLKICRGVEDIPNCVYKKNGKIIENPITYVQDEINSSEIYLSHLDEIIFPTYSSILGMFFIHTQKGCGMSCFYCAGCRAAQEKVFNRKRAYQRGVEEVRKDIIEAKKYVSTFMFDFEAPIGELLEYCRKIWEGIDLSSHFCNFFMAFAPSPQLIELVNKTFKYVYWNPDISSFSQRHRQQLFSLGLVKPQSPDEALLACFEEWDKYDNCEVKINTISGLPYFTPGDIRLSEAFLDKILNKYSSLTELHWGRLHAQPGAPLTEEADKYDMHSYAVNYDDFLKYSEMNFNQTSPYPNFEHVNYPFIYFNDEELNSKVSQHYVLMNQKVDRYNERKQDRLVVYNRLSYEELNNRANQLAVLLRERGVSAGHIVGVMMPNSLELAVGILGILKAGGAYLPIDPDSPQERVDFMLKDSSAVLLLTVNELTGICRNASCRDSTNQPAVHSPQQASGLAYILYTSGTTGVPNGVMVEHGGVVNFILWRLRTYGYTAEDVTLQLLSGSFDAFGADFYAGLLSGGASVMIPGFKRLDFDYISRTIRSLGVTNMSVVPGIYQALVDTAREADLENLRFVVLGGEKSSPNLVKKSKQKAPGVLLVNEYGPTETSVTAAANIGMEEIDSAVIGKPIANVQIYILNSVHEPVPVGVYGELCIAGAGVTRGYLNNPELTAKKFDHDYQKFLRGSRGQFFQKEPPGRRRLYKTGDLGRWLADGRIELLGRSDHQVKIRGNRIELGELETLLLRHREIEEIVVAADHETESGNNYLCAYFVARTELDNSELRNYLAAKLPDYMIPTYFVRLEEIPLTKNGKINRKALPDPKSFGRAAYEPPLNEMQQLLAAVWQEVLGVERVGINDSFFAIGGDSIKVIQMASRLRQQDLKMEIKDIFENPTIKQLEKYIKPMEIKTDQEPVEGEVALTPIQKWFFAKPFVHAHHFNQGVMFYRETGFDDRIVEKVFTAIVVHHDALRMAYEIEGNRVTQRGRGIREKLFDLEVIRVSDKPGAKIEEEIEREADRLQRSIDLREGPPVKLGLFKTGRGDHLLIVIHHLVVDGVSWRIILEDFISGYQQAEKNEEIRFQPKSDSFKSWSRELTKYADSKDLLKELDYWIKLGAVKLEPLPRDYGVEREKKQMKYRESISITINREQTRKLLHEVNRAYNTEINDILLTGLGISIREWGQMENIAINLEGHGREPIIDGVDVGRTVGWFTSQYPVVLEINETDDLGVQVKSVKETLRKIPNKGIGYGILKYLTPAEKTNGPGFEIEPEIGFNYMGEFQFTREKSSACKHDDRMDNDAFTITMSTIGCGERISPERPMNHALEISGEITGGRLHIVIDYNRYEYDRSSIKKLAEIYRSSIEKIIRHCSSKKEQEMTPSDLGDRELTIEELQDIREMIS
jgi:amino acid adenylation domain-containing protein/non-ribosomal peptide synthase protein (TIGR01720 family)